MLYDLNILWTPSTSTDELEKTLKFAKALGYDVVALNQIVSAPMPKTVTNAIPLITSPLSSRPGKAPSAPSGDANKASSSNALPNILRRVTIAVTDPGTTNYKLPEYARAHDILAVRPTTDKAFQWACLSADEASIISLDLSVPLGYHIAPRTAMAAVQRGLRFEICYGQAVQARGESTRARINFIGNTLALLRATKGRGLMASSEARSALGLRGPADVVNLLAVWGLGPEKGTEALRGCRGVWLSTKGIKRRGFRCVVDIVETAGPDPEALEKRENAGKKAQSQKGAPSAQQQGQKRKSDDGSGVDTSGASTPATISKRQAKKLRLAAGQAGKEKA